ncbi:Eukaryotic translation initiation factor 3 subunit E [Thelohanellus kitauei]|uniref:Eukaryotic translation initiation factor 3 subunit E n=1 Tax=Thelohanellus kitauei TaxID=669202 RepID=A0A0C2MLF3_THEKT|nr:Eukaryotic translation initiation factor 3 subunit E [Thelohanellus kitauei]
MITISEEATHFSKLEPYFDGHIGVMIYEYMVENKYVDRKFGLGKMIQFAQKTKMVSFTINLINQYNESDETPEDLNTLKSEVSKTLSEKRDRFRTISMTIKEDRFRTLIESTTKSHEEIIKTCYTLFDLPKNFHQIIYDYMTIMYDTGKYSKCDKYLRIYACLVNKKSDAYLECLWGQLYCTILENESMGASDLIDIIFREIQEREINHHSKILQVNHLLHLSLLVYFKSDNLFGKFYDVCSNNDYFRQALEVISPHLMRYVVVSALISSESDSDLQDLQDLMLNDVTDYSDCFVLFIKSLLCDYDVEMCIQQLKLCLSEFQHDYVIRWLQELFEARAYFQILKLYSLIHNSVSLQSIISTFGVDSEFAQILIRQFFSIENVEEVIQTTPTDDPMFKSSILPPLVILEEFSNKLKIST